MMEQSHKRKVSIVIPCRNEEMHISQCITSLINSDYPQELMEIIVCDGMSTDSTAELVEELAAKHSSIVKLENENQFTPHGLNLGIEYASGDVIIILGAHAEVYPGYIAKCVEALDAKHEAGCVGGVLESIATDRSSKAISTAMSSVFGVGSAHFRTGLKDGFVDTVAFGAYRKEVFEKIGLFDEELLRNQDDEFNYRLISSGFKIYLSKDIKSKYYVRSSFRNLLRQYFQYGYWKVYVNKKHKTITTMRQIVPSLFIVFLVAGFILSWLNTLVFAAYLAVLLVYVISAKIAAIQATWNVVGIAKTMLAFMIMHIGYGVGYLEGLLHFYICSPVIKNSLFSCCT